MHRIHSRHFQICRIDKYWQILFAKVVARHYSSIYARMSENVDEYSVFACYRPFSNCMMRSKIKHAARWPKLSFSLTLRFCLQEFSDVYNSNPISNFGSGAFPHCRIEYSEFGAGGEE